MRCMTGIQSTMAPGVTATAAEPVKSADLPPLSKAELTKLLRLGSIELVGELWAITQKQVDFEVARHGRLEAKANSLLTAVGLSLTVASTFGATLFSKLTLFGQLLPVVIVIYCAAMVAGVASALLAFQALKLVEQKQVEERAVFNEQTLEVADRTNVADEKEGLMAYRQSLILHFWEIRQQYDSTYRPKSVWVQRGQTAFGFFLTALLILCIAIAVAVSLAKNDAAAGAEGSNRPAAAEADQRGSGRDVAPRLGGHSAPAPSGAAAPAATTAPTKERLSAEAQGSDTSAPAAPSVGSALEGHD
jgi:hypothetical protein